LRQGEQYFPVLSGGFAQEEAKFIWHCRLLTASCRKHQIRSTDVVTLRLMADVPKRCSELIEGSLRRVAAAAITESRRSMELLKIASIPGIDSAALPNGPWDVRNFGWAPGKGSFQTHGQRDCRCSRAHYFRNSGQAEVVGAAQLTSTNL
jgi:hypothetical protein